MRKLWHSIVSPYPGIQTQKKRDALYIANGVLLANIPVLIGASLYVYLTNGITIAPIATMMAVVMIGVMLVLHRTRYYRYGTVLGLVYLFAMHTWIISTYATAHVAMAYIFNILLAFVFSSIRVGFATWAAVIISLAVMTSLQPTDWGNMPMTYVFLTVAMGITAINKLLLERAQERLGDRTHQLEESEQRFRRIINRGNDVYLLLRPEPQPNGKTRFIVEDVNDSMLRITRESREAFIGKPYHEIPAAARLGLTMLEAGKLGDDKKTTLRFKVVTESERHYLYDIIPIDGKVALLGRDRTKQQRASDHELALEVERKRVAILSEFIENITHDLLTPITIIQNQAYLLGRTETLSERGQERLEHMQTHSKHLQKMITDLTEMQRIDMNDERSLQLETTDISDMLTQLIESFRDRTSQQITLELPPEPIKNEAEPYYLARAVLNLLENAAQHTEPNGEIRVRGWLSNEYVYISVWNDGPMIPKQHLPHLFDRFYRVQTHRPSDGHLGLGLAITRKLVERHKGNLSVQSDPEAGTTFTIRIPIVERITSRVEGYRGA